MRKHLVGFVIFAIATCAASAEKNSNPCKNEEYPKIMKEKTEQDFSKGDYYLALDDILAVKKCNDKDAEAYYWLGRIYQARMEMVKAEENFLLAVKYNKNYSQAYLSLGDMYLVQKKLELSLENYKKAAADDTYRDAYMAWNNIGWIYMVQENYTEAETALLRSLALHSNFCNPYSNLGEIRTKQKKYDEAVVQFQKAVLLCPTYARPHRLLGLEYNRQGKVDEACREFDAARKNAPADSEDGLAAAKYLKILNCPVQPAK
jgi:protein O-mannosyl-transferase